MHLSLYTKSDLKNYLARCFPNTTICITLTINVFIFFLNAFQKNWWQWPTSSYIKMYNIIYLFKLKEQIFLSQKASNNVWFWWMRARFCEKSYGTSVAQMTENSTGNRKDLGSIPSGVEAFLFSQKMSLKKQIFAYYLNISNQNY